MKKKDLVKRARKLAKPFRVSNGKNFRLKNINPADTLHFKSEDKPKAKEALKWGIDILSELQDKLYAQDRWAILLIFQAMDAAGKDSAIKHVMSGINPQGCQVFSFKAPTTEDLDHDFMWRCLNRLPERGRIGIFNRSYYEETLIVRVHQEILEKQKIPDNLISKHIWDERFQDIKNIEKYLSRNGVIIRKFFLHVSEEEQRKRFLERIDNPDKNWKFSSTDSEERRYWKDYMKAYEEMIRNTSTKNSPWYVIPADNKWFTRLIVAAAIVETLASLDLHYPEVTTEKLKDLTEVRKKLL